MMPAHTRTHTLNAHQSNNHNDSSYFDSYHITEIVKTARRIDYHSWWNTITNIGYCLQPITLHNISENNTGPGVITIRCGNRRASICPSCSELYAGDMWQLIHTGLTGGKHDIPDTIATHPLIFLTLTAPSYGPGKTITTHSMHDEMIEAWEPDNPTTYDYIGHVLFTWWAPELWRRFTITLRRELTSYMKKQGINPKNMKLSFLKIMEYQNRAIPHYHTILRLDNNETTSEEMNIDEFIPLITKAHHKTQLTIPSIPYPDQQQLRWTSSDVALGFGEQIDMRIITPPQNQESEARGQSTVIYSPKVASYLTKYVTKSLTDIGYTGQKITHYNWQTLNMSPHHYRICSTIHNLSQHEEYAKIADYYSSFGYRGHITTKSRTYSTTMTHLREIRRNYQHDNKNSENLDITSSTWQYHHTGHKTIGEYELTYTAAINAKNQRTLARETRHQEQNHQL